MKEPSKNLHVVCYDLPIIRRLSNGKPLLISCYEAMTG